MWFTGGSQIAFNCPGLRVTCVLFLPARHFTNAPYKCEITSLTAILWARGRKPEFREGPKTCLKT